MVFFMLQFNNCQKHKALYKFSNTMPEEGQEWVFFRVGSLDPNCIPEEEREGEDEEDEDSQEELEEDEKLLEEMEKLLEEESQKGSAKYPLCPKVSVCLSSFLFKPLV